MNFLEKLGILSQPGRLTKGWDTQNLIFFCILGYSKQVFPKSSFEGSPYDLIAKLIASWLLN